ncbi:diguanylate cyclase [Paenibacillus marinisediminis]
MNKYQTQFILNLEQQLNTWFNRKDIIRSDELYHFLHTVKGTSGTIEMNELMQIASRLLNQIELNQLKEWTAEEVRLFLHDLRHYIETQSERSVKGSMNNRLNEKNVETDPSVLILDDDVNLLMVLKEELQAAGWSVIATTSSQKAIEYFHDVSPDCLIMDLNIPDTDGFEIMELLGEKLKKQYIPTTIITEDCSKHTRLRAYRMGVDDVICKPVDIEELLARLQRQITGKKRLDGLLFIDELTGAYNRKFMHEAFSRLNAESLRNSESFSMALLDLDRFKQINDTYGHLIGDQVLTKFTAFMKENLRIGDIFIRYGGEEFLVLLPKTELKEAQILLSALIEQFSKVDFYTADGIFTCTFSGGVVYVDNNDLSIHRWIEMADQALYAAKSLGRRRVVTKEDIALTPLKRKLQLVIVDDDILMQTMLSDHFNMELDERLDVILTKYRDGESFLEQLPAEVTEPYLVLLDGLLPGMDGLEVLERIRKLPHAEMFTVIMLTGRTAEQDIVKALQLGADDYVTKPFRIKELEARIRRLIRKWV